MTKWPLQAAIYLACAACVPPALPTGDIDSQQQELRPTDPFDGGSAMFRYAVGEVVESLALDGGAVRVHFSRSGPNSVGASGDTFTRLVAQRYGDIVETYETAWGYPRALSDATLASNGGDARLDVYLLDFGGRADGAFRLDECLDVPPGELGPRCIGYVVQENDFAGYGYPSLDEAVTILGSHEYFHAVQQAIDGDQPVPISEGSAVWATERYAPDTEDFEHFLPAFLNEPTRTLDLAPSGPATAGAYGTGLFFQFLDERFGAEVIRQTWLRCQNGRGAASEPADQANPRFLVQLDATLRERDAGFTQAFTEFAQWNLLLGAASVPDAGYRAAARYPPQAAEDVALPFTERSLRVFYAATRPLRVALDGRTRLRVALAGEGNVGPAPAAVRTVLAFRSAAGKTVGFRTLDGTDAVTDVPAGATHAVIAVVNGARAPEGSTIAARPSVCAGTEAEVAFCQTGDAGVDGGLDAGVPDGGAGGGTTDPGTGCGCSGGAGVAELGWLLGLVVLGRRRSRAG